ncbi:MaoC family dehydratase [Parvularcula oceani]|uniref:MaoC family dehydratase n=1 Tax=Parvularcula oceani TaxID=1247963 RepID=UPI0004E14F87|nr:MaoC family dehydratase [Parvularcula oceani]
MSRTVSLEELKALVGQEIGPSDWLTIDQSRIDTFADVTEDHQFIHVDPEAAAKTPFGGTIAHGFLTLSLLSAMVPDDYPLPENVAMGVNYGFDKVRFVQPVRSGQRVRSRLKLLAFEERAPKQYQSRWDVTVEIEGGEKPALKAEWLTLAFVQ